MKSQVWLKGILVAVLTVVLVGLPSLPYRGQPQLVELTFSAWCDNEPLKEAVKVELNPGPPGPPAQPKEVTVPAGGASSQPVAYRLNTKVTLTALTPTATSQSGKSCANPSFSENPVKMITDKAVKVTYTPQGANNPPNTPSTPSGPTSGTVGTSYTYSTSATDPDNDQVKYTFDWGDGTTSDNVEGFVSSGTTGTASHSWSTAGIYLVKARATDSKGEKSSWSGALQVTISAPPPPPQTVTLTVDAVCEGTSVRPTPAPKVEVFQFRPRTPVHVETTPWSGTFTKGVGVELTVLAASLQANCPFGKAVFDHWKWAGSVGQVNPTWPADIKFDPLDKDTTATAVYKPIKLPDLIVSSMTWRPETPGGPYVGDPYVYFDIVIKNQGQADANLAGMQLSIYKIKGTQKILVGQVTWTMGVLAAGASLTESNITTMQYSQLTWEGGTFPVRACVDDPSNVVPEDKTNNCLEKSITIAGQAGKLTVLAMRVTPPYGQLTVPINYSVQDPLGNPIPGQLGTQPTAFTLSYPKGFKVKLDAPPTITIAGVPYSFVRWVLDPGAQPFPNPVTVTLDSVEATAEYIPGGAVILSVQGLGEVLYSGAPPNCNILTIRSTGQVIEWSLESGGSYTQGVVAANGSGTVSIPHYKTFTLTIARPVIRKMGWIHARENDCKLAVIKNAGPGIAVALGSGGTLLDVANLGNVKATGPGNTMMIRSTGNVIEWSLESGGTYTQGEVAANGSGTLSIPHYRTFTLTIARPVAGLIGAIHCRENDSIVVCTAGFATGQVGIGSGGVLLDVPGLGNIKATGPGNTVTITSTGNFIEWSLESGDSYQGGEVLIGQSRTITIPHWKTFTLTIARPGAGLIGAMRCRENDGWIVCLKGSAFVPL